MSGQGGADMNRNSIYSSRKVIGVTNDDESSNHDRGGIHLSASESALRREYSYGSDSGSDRVIDI